MRFRQEKNPLKLWVPPDTTFVRDSEWLMSTFQRGFSDEAITIVAEDVLTPEVIVKVILPKTSTHAITKVDCMFHLVLGIAHVFFLRKLVKITTVIKGHYR